MKENQNLTIYGESVMLVPYRECHVEKYHRWMTNAELQELTASEPLTLEQEYNMQAAWRDDKDKCTFIVLHKDDFERSSCEIDSMIGDVNLFFNCEEEPTTAEIEIMIAESSKRNRGLGKQALLLMMRFGIEKLGVKTLVAKIKLKNLVSIKLFKDLHFREISMSQVFGEVTMTCLVDDAWKAQLVQKTSQYTVSQQAS